MTAVFAHAISPLNRPRRDYGNDGESISHRGVGGRDPAGRRAPHLADLGAARLSGDPEALAAALARLDRYQGQMWRQVLLPGYQLPEPSVLRSHPATQERIRRLAAVPPGDRLDSLRQGLRPAPSLPARVMRPPRWRGSGLWY